ncbi:7tm 1 domain containing protein [Trichuris trichiura]|uniref:7tm 1 domain containing protein n=1 Tax=Trichuris trichiura TaxID=36087 RepID=A0A077ZI69_TRITR|nr:7tm 1 domain containing protein [Trichuris trichiura]
MTGVMRASLYLNKLEMMDPFSCILTRYDMGILVIGQDGLTLSGFLLSFERFMFFTNVNAYQRIFNPVCTKHIIYCAFIVGILDYMLCWFLAYSRRAEQIQGHCQRSETTSESYFAVYMIVTVLLAAGSLIFYLLTFLSVSNWGRQNNEKGSLRQLRHIRERKILNSLALVSVLIAAMNLLPWFAYFFIFHSTSNQIMFNAAKLLDNLYLPVSTLLYLIIHPDLSPTEEDLVDSMMVTKECSSAKHYPVQLHSAVLTYNNGKYAYPVDISQPATLWIMFDNSDKRISNVSADLTLQKKVQKLGINKWISVPTFGLLYEPPVNFKNTVIINLKLNNTGEQLNNITSQVHVSRKTTVLSYVKWIPIPVGSVIKQKVDKCTCCPIKKGINVIKMVIDTDKYPVIKKIPLSGEYSLELTLADPNSTAELFCGTIQMELV